MNPPPLPPSLAFSLRSVFHFLFCYFNFSRDFTYCTLSRPHKDKAPTAYNA